MPQWQRGNRDLIREINCNLVLNVIKSQGPISRTDIARRSGLSLATISGIVADFVEKGLVQEIGAGTSTGGRKPVLLGLNPRAGFVVGLKLMEHAITSALTDLDATVLHHRITHLHGQRDLDSVVKAIIESVWSTIDESGVDISQVRGIGVGMAGVIDGRMGLCRYSPFFGWCDAPLGELIEREIGLPVYLDNDVNTLTIAEQWFGYGHSVDHFIVVTVGRGVGAGFVLNGQFYRGALGGAGELGHLVVEEDGPLCSCGKHGCLETLSADPAVLRQARMALEAGEDSVLAGVTPLTIEGVAQVAEDGDALAQRILGHAGHMLGIGIAYLVNLLNPQLIIVGGEGVRAGRYRLEPMREAIYQHSFNDLAQDLQIVIEPCGDETWARGAASLVLGEMFQSPIRRESTQRALAKA